MAFNMNYFLNKKYQELYIEENIITEELYNFVADERLKYIFSVLHQQFNKLIKFMYSKTNFHFNAQESRELNYYINIYEELKSNLKDTGNAFELNKEYELFLDYCKSFLQNSGGSTIPYDLKKIDVKEYEPIFSFVSKIEVKSLYKKSNYEIKLIGEGSYAKVYKYYDGFYNRWVVIKKANKNLNSKEIKRFRQEFDIMKKINSPYILKVYSYNEINNEYYAEYADITLHDYILKNNNKISNNERYNIILQILKGFKYISSKGLLHRDISLTNILLKKYDDCNIVKISDFGLVKINDSSLTSTESEIKGSLNDESNLQIVGFSNYSIIHETYALTRLLLFVLTGKTNLEKVSNQLIKEFVLKGTSGNLSIRYQSIEELEKNFISLYKKIVNLPNYQ